MKIQENKRITRKGAQVDDSDNQEIEEMINKRNYPSPTTSKPASQLTSKKAKTLKSSPKQGKKQGKQIKGIHLHDDKKQASINFSIKPDISYSDDSDDNQAINVVYEKRAREKMSTQTKVPASKKQKWLLLMLMYHVTSLIFYFLATLTL